MADACEQHQVVCWTGSVDSASEVTFAERRGEGWGEGVNDDTIGSDDVEDVRRSSSWEDQTEVRGICHSFARRKGNPNNRVQYSQNGKAVWMIEWKNLFNWSSGRERALIGHWVKKKGILNIDGWGNARNIQYFVFSTQYLHTAVEMAIVIEVEDKSVNDDWFINAS
jgi:hypothetical protein